MSISFFDTPTYATPLGRKEYRNISGLRKLCICTNIKNGEPHWEPMDSYLPKGKPPTQSHMAAQKCPEKAIWSAMLRRCRNPNSKFYSYYGGRGIKVCDRWLHSFENFLADMGKKPANLSLDRIDNDGNYEPSNCRWASWPEQMRNRRSCVWLEFQGEKILLTDAIEQKIIHKDSLRKIRKRLKCNNQQAFDYLIRKRTKRLAA